MVSTGFYPKVNSKVFPIQRVPVAGIKPLTIIANKLSSGSATVDTIYENIQEASVNTLFGTNSNLSRAIKTAFSIDKQRIINAIALAEAGGDVAATASIALGGTISNTRQAVIKSGNDSFSTSVSSTTTLAALATALNTAINSATSRRFSSTVSTSTLTLTSLQKGTCGNYIPLEVYFLDENSARINEITLTYSGFSGGTGASSMTNALSVLSEFDVEMAIDTSLALDAANISSIKTFLGGRLNSDNAIRNGFAYVHYIDSVGGLTSRFGAAAFGNVPLFLASSSKSVSKTGKSGSEDGNYPLDIAVGISCINSAIVTGGADVYTIMPHKPLGSITNQGVARGGMIIPGFSVSSDASEGWTSSGTQPEVSTLEALQVNAVRTRNGNLEIGEMYTQSTEESYKSFPEMSIVTRIQGDIFLQMKQYKNQIINNNVMRSIRGDIINYINEAASATHNWLSDDNVDIDSMLKSITLARVTNNAHALGVTFTVKTVNALQLIPVNIFVNTLNL